MRATSPLAAAAEAVQLYRTFASRYGAAINWFPGHMASATAKIADIVSKCDYLLEVRDARVPFSSRNPILDNLVAACKFPISRVVVFNKADLASENLQRFVEAELGAQGVTCLFTSAHRGLNVPRLLKAVDALPSRAKGFRVAGATMLVAGIPNVGKSSIINAIRNSTGAKSTRGAKTGAAPGITRQVSTFLVRERPPLYMFDSPGIMLPRIDSVETGLRLCVTGALPDNRVPWAVQAEFLLWTFEGLGISRYVQAAGLDKAYTADEVEDMLVALANKLHARVALGEPDTEAAARHFVRLYQQGAMGRFTLDAVVKRHDVLPPPTPPKPKAGRDGGVAAASAAAAGSSVTDVAGGGGAASAAAAAGVEAGVASVASGGGSRSCGGGGVEPASLQSPPLA